MSNLKNSVNKILTDAIAFRQELHRWPELSWNEYETIKRIERFLRDHELPGFKRVGETGGVLDMHCGQPNAGYVLLRADIDALPIQDQKSANYASKNEGVCHACAHDVHTAIVCSTAIVLSKYTNDLPYNIRFLFQPAEEPIPSGAPEMIKHGALDNVVAALGMHIEPRLSVGTFGLADSWINMQSVRIDLELRGPGGHSARPYETTDLLWAASRIIQDGYQSVYRKINLAGGAVVLTFTEIEAAQGYNVIPSELRLTGTLRTAIPEKKQAALEELETLFRSIETDTGCTINHSFSEGAPAIFNDIKLTQNLREIVASDFWLPHVIDTDFRTPGADDFSHYLKHVPGVMVRIGGRRSDNQAGLHDGNFDVPEAAIEYGIGFFVRVLLGLGKKI